VDLDPAEIPDVSGAAMMAGNGDFFVQMGPLTSIMPQTGPGAHQPVVVPADGWEIGASTDANASTRMMHLLQLSDFKAAAFGTR
jgi:hypothetical protein